MSENQHTPLKTQCDLIGASDTQMTSDEVSDFQDHVAIMITLKSAVNRGSIPALLADETAQHSWNRVEAYIDAYDVDPALTDNPVPRARTALTQSESDERGIVISFLSDAEWKVEERALNRAYRDDESFHFVVTTHDQTQYTDIKD